MPELAVTDEWRRTMVRARKELGLSQEQLAEKLGCSQVMVSKLESGAASSSTYVMPICRLLGIAPPEHYEDEATRSWVQLGRLLRNTNPEQFRAALAMVESIAQLAQVAADRSAAAKVEPVEPAEPPDQSKSRK